MELLRKFMALMFAVAVALIAGALLFVLGGMMAQGDTKLPTVKPALPRIAVVDMGIDVTHPDFKKNKMIQQDFASTCKDDNYDHGTHVTGIILKNFPQAEIRSYRYYSSCSLYRKNLNNEVTALRVAIKSGSKIINLSGGGPYPNDAELSVLIEAKALDILVVVAAGNERMNLSKDTEGEGGYYPCGYGLSNIICVTALTNRDGKPTRELVRSANYNGEAKVAALGENVRSTLPKGKYGYMTGTSMATPFITGVAAAYWVAHPNLKASDIKDWAIKTYPAPVPTPTPSSEYPTMF